MNLLILEDQQFISHEKAITNHRQREHIRSVLKLANGDAIKIGRINRQLGQGVIAHQKNDTFIENILFNQDPPPTLPITLLLAMPRPQMLKRILQTISCLGVEKLCLLQTGKVEKGFWQSPSATDEAIREQLILGLEQGVATQLPIIEKYLRLRDFFEQALDDLASDTLKLIAHPAGMELTQHPPQQKICIAIGPEGGFLKEELEIFNNKGFINVGLGARILKVETAVPVALAKLYPL